MKLEDAKQYLDLICDEVNVKKIAKGLMKGVDFVYTKETREFSIEKDGVQVEAPKTLAHILEGIQNDTIKLFK